MESQEFKVLLIEDDHVDQMAFRRLVREMRLPYDYQIASSVTEALKCLNTSNFDIVITDYYLGDGTAFDVFDVSANTPIIFATGAGDQDVAVKAMKAGAYDYLIKDSERNYLRTLPVTIDKAIKHWRTEKALKESEERYRYFFEQNLAGDYICATNGKLLACNHAFALIFGFSSIEEAVSANLTSFFADSEKATSFINKVRQERILRLYELELLRRDGKPISIIQNVIGVFDQHDNLVKIQGFVFDMTERRKLEEQLQQVQKMESIGTLAGGIAHDFNNILAAILGRASFMKMRISETHPLFKELDIIEKSANRAAELTAQLLAFARGGKYQTRPLDLNDIVRETCKMLYRTFDKLIEIETDLNDCLPTIEADPSQVHQVIMNLCINARDAMPNGGKLVIKTSVTNIDDDDLELQDEAMAGSYVTLAVTDSGIGMDKAIMQRIFEPFFSTKDKAKGAGLGLASVYGIVKNHGGFINVTSEVKKGSTFRIFFPICGKQEIHEQTLRETPQGTDECVLVVDDEDFIRDLAKDILLENGYQVYLAEDGEKAIEMFRLHQHEIAVVILDMIMPKMAAGDILLKLRELDPNVRILLSTGYSKDGKAQELLQQGIQGFVQKPYGISDLLTQVRRTIDCEDGGGKTQDLSAINTERAASVPVSEQVQ